jgi:hypothetical protein
MMPSRARLAVLSLALALSTTTSGAQEKGIIFGTAPTETRAPFSDYLVRVRDAETGELAGLSAVGEFATYSAEGLPLARPLLIELHDVKNGRIICLQGPYRVTAAAPILTDVIIECGKKPAANWLLPASAGLPAVVAPGIHGVSR